MMADGLNVSVRLLIEFCMAHTKGINTQIDAMIRTIYVTARTRQLAASQSTRFMLTLFEALSQCIIKKSDHNGYEKKIKNPHRRTVSKIVKLDRGIVIKDAKELGADPRAASRQRKGDTEGFKGLNQPEKERDA